MESDGDLEEYLKTAAIQYVRPLPGGGGHQDKKILVLRGGVAVAAKPGHTADYETQAKCEVAAWLLAAELDMTELVPMTVWREVPAPGGEMIEGSAQVLWPEFKKAEQNFRATDCPDDRAWLIAVFDCLAMNTDRNDGNWGAITALPDAVLIDHGHCFLKGQQVNSQFFEVRRDQDIPDHTTTHLQGFLHTAENTRLREVLEDDVVQSVIERAEYLTDAGILALP